MPFLYTIHFWACVWLIGSCVVAIDMLETLDKDLIAQYKFNKLTKEQKIFTMIELGFIAFIGSWFIVVWRLYTCYIKHFRRRR